MSQVGYIFLAFFLGHLSGLVVIWLQEKMGKYEKEIEILSETLRCLFSTSQTYNNLLTDSSVLKEALKEFPERSNEIAKQMYERLDKVMRKDFFPQLMFHSFQLKRLKDKSFWKDFAELMSKYDVFGRMLMKRTDMDKIYELNNEILTLMRKFQEKCLSKVKI